MTAEYQTAVSRAVSAMAGAVSGETAQFKSAIMECVQVRGGVVEGGFLDTEIFREVIVEVLDRFIGLLAAGLAPKADISPEIGEAADEELAKIRARVEAQFSNFLDDAPPWPRSRSA